VYESVLALESKLVGFFFGSRDVSIDVAVVGERREARQPHIYLDGTWHVSLVGRCALMCSFYRIFLADFIERIFYLVEF
jgi:hypothetical protein